MSEEESVMRTTSRDLNDCLVRQRSFLEELERCDAIPEEILAKAVKQKKAIEQHIPRTLRAIQGPTEALSPFSRVPAEILTLIFEFAITFPVSHWYKYRVGPTTDRWWRFQREENALWSIELVCKTWRQNILDNPYLWSCLNICLSPNNVTLHRHRQKYASRVTTHLRRAESCALSICIFISPSFTERTLPGHLPLLLLPFADRIKHLSLCMNLSLIYGLAPLENHLRSLVRLHILITPFCDDEVFGMEDSAGRIIGIVDMFVHCPLLQTLETVDMTCPDKQVIFPWETIIHYSTSFARDLPDRVEITPSVSADNLRQILSQAELLETCYAEFEFGYLDDSQRVTCEKLTSLHLVWYSGKCQQLEALFHKLYLPALTALKVETPVLTGAEIEDGLPLVVDVLKRSHCPLQELEYPLGDQVDEDTIIECLSASRTLERLCFNKVGSVNYPITMSVVIVQLSSLDVLHTVILRGHLHLQEGNILTVVKARARFGRPLRHVELAWASSNSMAGEEVKERLDNLVQGIENYRSGGLVSPRFKLETSFGVDSQHKEN